MHIPWKNKFFIIGEIIVGIIFLILALLTILSIKEKPAKINYGLSFSAPYTRELGLNDRETFSAILNDLGVRKFRLIAYWNDIEKENGIFDYSDLDFQIDEAEKVNAEVILALGRRVPRWPECHIPDWAKKLSWEEQKPEIQEFIAQTVNRYKDRPAVKVWQVENEPFLDIFAVDFCGKTDEAFLKQEMSLVKQLDPTRHTMTTDSGNLGLWAGAYRNADIFGTSAYLYLWNPEIGPVRSILPPHVYRIKDNLMALIYGEKPTILSELSIEPWLTEPIVNAPLEVQFERMSLEKFDEIIGFGEDTNFADQYLWGVEWWYWLKVKHDKPEFWDKARELFKQ